MRSTQKSFIDKMRKAVLSLSRLVEQAEAAYDKENDTHNTLKQVLSHIPKEPHGDREQGWLDGCARDRAQNNWLLALISKDETQENLVATIAELKELVAEAIDLVAAAGEGSDDFVRKAKILTVLASAALFEANRWQGILLVEKPRLSVDDDVLKHRYARAEHEVRVTHCKR
jgi:hypothetical protein